MTEGRASIGADRDWDEWSGPFKKARVCVCMRGGRRSCAQGPRNRRAETEQADNRNGGEPSKRDRGPDREH